MCVLDDAAGEIFFKCVTVLEGAELRARVLTRTSLKRSGDPDDGPSSLLLFS